MFKGVIMVIMSVLGLVQTSIYHISLGKVNTSVYLSFANAVARNFLPIFCLIGGITGVLLIVSKKKDDSSFEASNLFFAVIFIATLVCLLLSIM